VHHVGSSSLNSLSGASTWSTILSILIIVVQRQRHYLFRSRVVHQHAGNFSPIVLCASTISPAAQSFFFSAEQNESVSASASGSVLPGRALPKNPIEPVPLSVEPVPNPTNPDGPEITTSSDFFLSLDFRDRVETSTGLSLNELVISISTAPGHAFASGRASGSPRQ